MSVISVLCFLALWMLGFLILWRLPSCLDPAPVPAALPPAISVVIPARNEAGNLPLLLQSLGRQSLAPREVIVVDDHSEDGTGEAARRGGARVIRSRPLPPDWLGKPWACWQGARASSGVLLVFLDADTVLEPEGLRRLAFAWTGGGGLVSVWPYHRMKRAYERLSAFINVVVAAGTGVFTPWGRAVRSRGAFGPCLVCSRSDYFSAGGHERVRADILDDIAFGELFAGAGRPVRLFCGRGTVQFRMYPYGIASIVEGFGKNLATGASRISPALLLTFLGWITGGFIVTYYLAAAAAAGQAGWAAAWLVAYLLYAGQVLWLLSRLGNFGPAAAAGFPLPLVFLASVFLASLVRTFVIGQVGWKGRRIRIRGRRR